MDRVKSRIYIFVFHNLIQSKKRHVRDVNPAICTFFSPVCSYLPSMFKYTINILGYPSSLSVYPSQIGPKLPLFYVSGDYTGSVLFMITEKPRPCVCKRSSIKILTFSNAVSAMYRNSKWKWRTPYH